MARAPLAAVLVVATCSLAGAIGACVERPPPRLVAPELDTPPAPRRTSARAGSPTRACAGHSDDPPPGVLDAATAQVDSDDASGYAELLALAIAWPHSATVRVRAAEIAPREPNDALRLYAEAVRLHDLSCTLAPDDLRAALHGLGAALLGAGDLPGARAAFARAAAEFPGAAPVRYAYAATLCRLRERDGCVTELLATLDLDDATDALRELATRDPDFESVRSDPRVSARFAALRTP